MSAAHIQSPSTAMTVISANVEGLTDSKASTISNVEGAALPLSLSPRNTPIQRLSIPGMALVAECPHDNNCSSEGEQHFCL